MRRVQDAALDLFEAHGFDQVTIEQIAVRADVGPATIYRNFTTKERIVTWDDYDPELMVMLAERLPGPILDVVRDAVIDSIAPIYQRDRERLLRRSRLLLDVPAIAATSAGEQRQMCDALSEVFVRRKAVRTVFEGDVIAAAIVGLLAISITHWVRADGKTALSTIVRRAFACLRLATASESLDE